METVSCVFFENNKREGGRDKFVPLPFASFNKRDRHAFIPRPISSRGLINSWPERKRRKRAKESIVVVVIIIIIIIERSRGSRRKGTGHFRSSVKFPASAHCSATIVLVSRGRRFPLSPPFVRFRGRISRLLARARDGVQAKRERRGERTYSEIKG